MRKKIISKLCWLAGIFFAFRPIPPPPLQSLCGARRGNISKSSVRRWEKEAELKWEKGKVSKKLVFVCEKKRENNSEKFKC